MEQCLNVVTSYVGQDRSRPVGAGGASPADLVVEVLVLVSSRAAGIAGRLFSLEGVVEATSLGGGALFAAARSSAYARSTGTTPRVLHLVRGGASTREVVTMVPAQ